MLKKNLFYAKKLMLATALSTITPLAIAASRPEPVPLYGSYVRHLDRAKQTFNGKYSPNQRSAQQKEDFFTACKASGCLAQTPNLSPLPGESAYMDYHWKHGRWELEADLLFICNDGSKVKARLFESLTSKGNGHFSGERSITMKGESCPETGAGVYRLPFTLIPE